jgi:mRNA interferase MazF
MKRGEIYWANLEIPKGNEPGDRRPVLIIQSDLFNGSSIPTVMVAVLTTNLGLGKAPGNVVLKAEEAGLPRDSVVNVSQILTVNRSRLTDFVCELDPALQFSVDNGLRLAFDL